MSSAQPAAAHAEAPFLFKALYYVFSLVHIRQSLAAWQRRRWAIRDPQAGAAAS